MIKCRDCRQIKEWKEFYYRPRCKVCFTKYNREYKKTRRHRLRKAELDAIYREKNKEKITAHKILNNALRNGELKKMGCVKCGKKQRYKLRNVHAHHEDYSKPLDVKWLCQLHHKEEHKLKGLK